MDQLKSTQDNNTKVINSILKFTAIITLIFLIFLLTIYWHGQYLAEKRLIPYDKLTTSGFYSAHLAFSQLIGVAYLFCLVASVITILLSFFNKVEKSIKPLLFNILTHSSLFLYLKYSSFLDWAID